MPKGQAQPGNGGSALENTKQPIFNFQNCYNMMLFWISENMIPIHLWLKSAVQIAMAEHDKMGLWTN